MSHPVSVFRMKESVGRIMEVLKTETHNGFPVVEDYNPDLQNVIVYTCLFLPFLRNAILYKLLQIIN